MSKIASAGGVWRRTKRLCELDTGLEEQADCVEERYTHPEMFELLNQAQEVDDIPHKWESTENVEYGGNLEVPRPDVFDLAVKSEHVVVVDQGCACQRNCEFWWRNLRSELSYRYWRIECIVEQPYRNEEHRNKRRERIDKEGVWWLSAHLLWLWVALNVREPPSMPCMLQVGRANHRGVRMGTSPEGKS